jgi:dTDP-4-dehydrorhamnose 3,5-epimerase
MSSRFEIIATPLPGLQVLQRKPLGDSRGYLERMFCAEELEAILAGRRIVQINHTLTASLGTVRGLHFQHPPHAETKFVSCMRGEVFDVAVDLRRDSPMFLRWHGEILSADNHRTLMIPEGFAHGFQTLAEDCEMLYFHTAAYRADAESGFNALDPVVAIKWPRDVVMMSDRDRSLPLFSSEFNGLSEVLSHAEHD